MLREHIYRLGGWRFWALTIVWFVIGVLLLPLVWMYHAWAFLWFWNRWGRRHVMAFWLVLANLFMGAQLAVLSNWMIGAGMLVPLSWVLVDEGIRRISVPQWVQELSVVFVVSSSFVLLQGTVATFENWMFNAGFVMVVLLFDRVSQWRQQG